MKKVSVVSLLLAFTISTMAFAHKGEVHSYMGTITELTTGGFTLKDTKGREHTLKTSEATTYTHADNHAARRSELRVGIRVVVKVDKDGETVTNVKMAAEASK